MKIKVLPQTSYGKKALIVFGLFIVMILVSNIIVQLQEPDIDGISRLITIVTGLIGIVSAFTGLALSVLALTKQKERAILVFLPLLIGLLMLIFIIGEVTVPH